MSVHTKKRHIELIFVGPYRKRAEAITSLERLGFHVLEDSVPWREAFPKQDQSPGALLAGARYKEALTQVQLSKRTGIPQRHISEMENNKRSIGKSNAKIFAAVLKVDYRVFL
jgi:hypothetical protein